MALLPQQPRHTRPLAMPDAVRQCSYSNVQDLAVHRSRGSSKTAGQLADLKASETGLAASKGGDIGGHRRVDSILLLSCL
ncbi:hypothetical protein JMJ77_0014059 [Colletotrichum scovillei]|uniref:Uncharacterized protein n=1 Tax=Colletotrichum scovillei TaxID=1209932 RepID=A0A9P7R5Y6_9PEZI|nr:hypothetical protein JMJ77_0014059 [Colletotrichum scovillei]KAG7065586.1 hypothetical protein JMJ78_0012334 [Colletotrichum scovillei]KAG7068186.1 hypothetical protein JMJ76_0007877 [Colletotrichum scovillei]